MANKLIKRFVRCRNPLTKSMIIMKEKHKQFN